VCEREREKGEKEKEKEKLERRECIFCKLWIREREREEGKKMRDEIVYFVINGSKSVTEKERSL